MASDFRYINNDSATIADASGEFFRSISGSIRASTEANAQTDIMASYTGQNLFAYCSAFSGTGTTTLKSRIDGADGSLTVTISATGIFEDTSNSDALVDTDLYNLIFTKTGGKHGDSVTITLSGLSLSHASDDLPILIATANTSALSLASEKRWPVDGQLDSNTTEANRQRTFRAAATLSNFRVYVSSFTSGSPVLKTRINGADGGQSVSPTATGSFEDTVNTDTIVAGDEVNTGVTTIGTASTALIQLKSASTALQHMSTVANGIAIDLILYTGLSGDLVADVTVEANTQMTMRTTNVLKNLFVYVSAYTLDAAPTVGLRINGATSFSVAPSATGITEDTSSSVTLLVTDEANYIMDTNAASSGSITLQIISIEETQPGGGTITPITPSGSITPTGALVKRVDKVVSGNITPTGALTKRVDTSYTGATTPVGALAHRVDKILVGETTPTGALLNGYIAGLIVVGATTPTGTLVHRVDKVLSGSITPTSSLTKEVQISYTGSITPIGALVKLVNKIISGAITPTGALVNSFLAQVLTTGSSTPVGTLVNEVQKVFVGSVTPTGTLVKLVNKIISGSIAPTGALVKEVQKFISGSITPVGVLVNSYLAQLLITASTTPIGSLVNEVQKFLSGATTPTGTLVKVVQKFISGSITPTGSLTKQVQKFLSGVITPTSTLVIAISKTFSGSITPSGSLTKQVSNSQTGSITPTGALSQQPQKSVAGSIVPTGALVHRVDKVIAGSFTPSGDLSKDILATYSGSITPTSALRKEILKYTTGSIAPSGTLSNTYIPGTPLVAAALPTMQYIDPLTLPIREDHEIEVTTQNIQYTAEVNDVTPDSNVSY